MLKTLIQCDFDGTVTEKDISHLLLDAFADGDWRRLLREYEEGRMSVGRLNTEVFAMVKADRESLLRFVKGIGIRPGFGRMVNYCRKNDFRLVIVSNGMDFYIEEILKNAGINGIEIFAARTEFQPQGLKIQYISPYGILIDDDFKSSHAALFLREGYRIIYAGNGISDLAAAKLCHHIFATGNLSGLCQKASLKCHSFTDFNEVVEDLEHL